MTEIRIGGLARLSSCDWPGQLVATIFCQGCPWACRYCHNPHLIPAKSETQIPWQAVVTFLEARRGLLDGVVFSGGEPTLQPDLESAIKQVKALGFRIGLHTGGPYPGRLAQVLPLVDWVGFDVKAPRKAYDRITGARRSGDKAMRSLRLLLGSGVDYDLRTTVHPDLLSKEELLEPAAEVSDAGGKDHRIQKFRPDGCVDRALTESSSTDYLATDSVLEVASLPNGDETLVVFEDRAWLECPGENDPFNRTLEADAAKSVLDSMRASGFCPESLTAVNFVTARADDAHHVSGRDGRVVRLIVEVEASFKRSFAKQCALELRRSGLLLSSLVAAIDSEIVLEGIWEVLDEEFGCSDEVVAQ